MTFQATDKRKMVHYDIDHFIMFTYYTLFNKTTHIIIILLNLPSLIHFIF